MSQLRSLLSSILFIFLVLSSTNVLAQNALEITGITNASNHDLATAATTPIIYGGVTGPIGACLTGTGNASTLCDNCLNLLGVETACNRSRLYPSTKLLISFKVLADIVTPGGSIFVGFSAAGGTATGLASGEYTTSGTGLVKDSTGSVEIEWSVLCAKATGYTDGTCSDPGTAVDSSNVLYISVEATQAFAAANTKNISLRILNPDFDPSFALTTKNSLLTCSDATPSAGICSFKASPGDAKISITDEIEQANTCPATFKKVRYFYSPVSFAAATYNAETFADLDLGTNCAPSGDWSITGLENDVPYYVRASILDIANNNVFLVDRTNEIDTRDNCVADDITNCRFIATPGAVDGLLPEDFNCFIATAAYGSKFSPKVTTFRMFRNQFLLTNEVGRKFVKFYYEYGPYGAKYISDKPWLRAATRALLTPPWAFAWLSLHYGIFGAFLIIFALIGASIYSVRENRHGVK